MIIQEKNILKDAAIKTANSMVVAARTAPKARGRNTLETLVITDEDIATLCNEMKALGTTTEQHFFLRDAANLEYALAIVLIGCRFATTDLQYCGLCGFESCNKKNDYPYTPCSFNTIDLGIAIGSAVSLAADQRFDNRIMYTIGMAVKKLQWFSSDVAIIIGIPISASSKNPFFDRA